MKKCAFLFLLFSAVATAQTGKEKILVTDMTRIKQITNINIAPDGKRAVYLLRSIEPNEENKLEYDYRAHIYLTDFKTEKPLTRGAEGSGAPVWSPDSRQIAFARSVKGKPQIFIMPLDGGEAWQLTDSKYPVASPEWSKDGTKILYTATLTMAEAIKDSLINPAGEVPAWSMEKPGFATNDYLKPRKDVKPNPNGTIEEIRAYLGKDEEDKKAKVFNRLNFQGESTTQPEMNFQYVFVIDPKEGAKPRCVAAGFEDYNGVRWLENGRIRYFTGLDPLKHPDREQDQSVMTMNADGTDKQFLLGEKGMNVVFVTYSPDGKKMILLKAASLDVNFPKVFLSDADGKNQQPVAFDRTIAGFAWSKDSKYIYWNAAAEGGQPLYRMEVRTQKIEQLSGLEAGILSFDVSGDKILYAKTEVADPDELFVADLSMKNPVQLTTVNDWVKTKALSLPEQKYFTDSKGVKIEYWVMKPANFEPGKKYPLMLNMHGGPTAMWGPGESSMWHEFQYFCSQGYGVVYTNPRGSGGYGLEFQRANIKDWGTGPAEDVLGCEAEAARLPWVDTARQVVTGGSYAGYLTAWIVGHDNRFKAAFAQRGVYDLTTFMGEGNAWRLIPEYFNYPWNDKTEKVLESNSPYTFVQNIQTPLLIKHGENDLRTGPIQSEMMYKSMKILGKEVEYVRMPGATHELSRSGNVRQRIDRMLRIYEFFERYVAEKKQRG